ncbi:MAG: rRNA pseudouridine synthase [Anaerolineales bacterium]|nr:rRNA pseudouridine synthase [Anaerolineales bacterium]
MAQAGLGSRRSCEEIIISGRVSVNGKTAVLGQKADPALDKIIVDGKPMTVLEPKVYVALYKPRKVLSTVESEPGDTRLTVRDLVPIEERLYPVGRLDYDSEGLVLMTNDGELANRLTHPRFAHEKEYRVLVANRPDNVQLEAWRRGVVLEDGYKTTPAQVQIESLSGKGTWLRVILKEGRKRQIREIGFLLGLPVVRIIRVRISSLFLGRLKPKEWRYLMPDEVSRLKDGTGKRNQEKSPGRPNRRKVHPRKK